MIGVHKTDKTNPSKMRRQGPTQLCHTPVVPVPWVVQADPLRPGRGTGSGRTVGLRHQLLAVDLQLCFEQTTEQIEHL